MFNKLQSILEKYVGPIATNINKNKAVQALSAGMILSMPISLGTSLLALFGNLPIPAWTSFLGEIGMTPVIEDVLSVTMSMLPVYIIYTISYNYAKILENSPVVVAVLSMAVFLILIPLRITTGDTQILALSTNYLGSNGIFLSMVTAIIVPRIYHYLNKKNIKIKLPDSVPPMISESLAPTFIAMIILFIAFLVKYLFSVTSYGNVFDAFNQTIGLTINLFGSSTVSMILFFTLCSLFWFFGVHPSPLLSLYIPFVMVPFTQNFEAFIAGQPMPHLELAVVFTALSMGATGSTLGLSISTLFGKSEKYKVMKKLVVVPNFFNINEPIIFGFPVMLNPVYFIPMILGPLASGFSALLLTKLLQPNINPAVSFPWIMPQLISTFFQGGFKFFLIIFLVVLVQVLIYYPFFRLDDQRALNEENHDQRALNEENQIVEGTANEVQ